MSYYIDGKRVYQDFKILSHTLILQVCLEH